MHACSGLLVPVRLVRACPMRKASALKCKPHGSTNGWAALEPIQICQHRSQSGKALSMRVPRTRARYNAAKKTHSRRHLFVTCTAKRLLYGTGITGMLRLGHLEFLTDMEWRHLANTRLILRGSERCCSATNESARRARMLQKSSQRANCADKHAHSA